MLWTEEKSNIAKGGEVKASKMDMQKRGQTMIHEWMMAEEVDPIINFFKIHNAINPTNANNINLDDTDEWMTLPAVG